MTAAEQAAPLIRALELPYRHGFVTDVESDTLPPGLDADTVRAISRLKREPEFLLKWRLTAFESWTAMTHPGWGHLRIVPMDFQAQSYYSAPKSLNAAQDALKSLAEVDPKLLETYEKLGVPLHERARLACGRGRRVRFGFGRHHFPRTARQGRRRHRCSLRARQPVEP